jgi:HAD superfamily phosphatase
MAAARADALRAQCASLRCILWDMDGVLIDVGASYRRAVVETAASFLGKECPPGIVTKFKNRGGYNNDWVCTKGIIDELGEGRVQVTLAEVTERFQKLYKGDNYSGYIATEPAAVDSALLAKLSAKYSMACATGRPRDEAMWTLRRHGWTEHIPVVVGMEQQGEQGKPHPFPLQEAVRQLRAVSTDADSAPYAPPAQMCYLGDTGDDMRAARAAGMIAIGCVAPNHDFEADQRTLEDAGAQLVLASPNELAVLL